MKPFSAILNTAERRPRLRLGPGPFRFFGLMLLAALVTSWPLEGREYESFKSIAQKNIFDSTRRPFSAPPARAEPPRPVRAEELSLTGVMVHERGALAFFEGSEAQFKKALRVNDAIAGFTVTEIGGRHVKLSGEEVEIDLPVGRRLSRRGDEPWLLAAEEEADRDRPRTGGSARPGGRSSSPSSPPADADEILKRLMEQRNQEMNR